MSEINCGSVRFVDIPEYFLKRYCAQINAWSGNLRRIGLVKSIFLREGYLAELSPDPELGAQMIVVRLKCRPLRSGGMVEISPLEERDRELIAIHCGKLVAAGIPAEAELREPARPFMPFMPTVVKSGGEI